MIKLYCRDCLEVLPMLNVNSIDAVIADPPYGTTVCKWDSVIPLIPMWKQLMRVANDTAPIVLFAAQPFTSALVMSNVQYFKYCWYWKKSLKTNFLNAKKQPLRQVNDIAVFYRRQATYNPQGLVPGSIDGGNQGTPTVNQWDSSFYQQEMTGYPTDILDFPYSNKDSLHPTQKPVALMEYLIRTYTNPGDTILDFAMGSGTTGVACIKTGRNFIGIELGTNYFKIAEQRIEETQTQPGLDGLQIGV